MNLKLKSCLLVCFALGLAVPKAMAEDLSIKVTKKYLNLPVSQAEKRHKMTFEVDGKQENPFVIRLAQGEPEYWVCCDLTRFKGKTLTIKYEGEPEGLSKIYQADTIAGQDSMYMEKNRPQFHFTTKRGWTNDPNGLVYHDGEYHLFYQYNPYEREWENMHWGHAVSKDLVHWEELPVALYPDHTGTMFSGSAVIDYDNTAGFNKGKKAAMVAAFTGAGPGKQVQGIAYSLDNGRTFTKYDKNPVIDSGEKWKTHVTRDPKVFWYKPSGHWVMVLSERDGLSIYTSDNLKEWNYESHISGFYECPEFFELPIDGNKNNTKWVMCGGSGVYMIGSFDGKVFTPELGKYSYGSGTLYAAQTFTNIPESDGRRIQIGWGRGVAHPGMPFKGIMLMPTELTLRTTKEGVRMFNEPVEELGQLFTKVNEWKSLSAEEANRKMKEYSNVDRLRIKTTIKLSHATSAGLNLFGQRLIDYDMSASIIHGRFYCPEDRQSMDITADIYIDRTTVEVFIDNGAYSYSLVRRPHEDNEEGFHFWGTHPLEEIKNLEVYSVKSIW